MWLRPLESLLHSIQAELIIFSLMHSYIFNMNLAYKLQYYFEALKTSSYLIKVIETPNLPKHLYTKFYVLITGAWN